MAQNEPKMAEGGGVGPKASPSLGATLGSGWVSHAERDREALGPHPTPFGHFGPVLGHFGPFWADEWATDTKSSLLKEFSLRDPTALRERARFRARRTQKALLALSAT